MATCPRCHGRGTELRPQSIGGPECYRCQGTGEVETDGDMRAECREQAIANTGYRESGSEMADGMAHRGLPWVVADEYQRLCRKRGIRP